jgi:hypothetical protein
MDYTEILKSAESKLSPGFRYITDEIYLKIASGSTGGEIGSLVGEYLKNLRDECHPAYLVLKSEVDTYLSQFIFK